MTMFYEELPKKIQAIRKIRRSKFYGQDHQDLVIEYVYSHAIWFVGSYSDYIEVLVRFNKEVIELDIKMRNYEKARNVVS